jgi:ABC-type transport system involved in multi-copper enzyme maturation permease subunit
MFQQTFAIARNTFLESIRQPIMLVVLVVATILIILANPLSAFTMTNDQRMYIDMGLATVFLCGALLAAFIATNVLGREIENRTALTVVSKPVGRPLFVLGKYLGVAAAITVGTLYMSFVFLLAEQHSVLQTVRDPVHAPVVLFGVGAALLGLGIGIWCNYFYDKVFSSTVICATTPLAGLAYLFSLMFKADFSLQGIQDGFKAQIWLALVALLIAILVLTAIAVAASTRLNQVLTLGVTIGIFLFGLMSDWFFGRPLLRLEQSLSQRVEGLTDASLQGMLADDNAESLRSWVLHIHNEQAEHRFSQWHCAALAEIFKQERQLRDMPPADREARERVIEEQQFNAAHAQRERDRTEARVRAGQVAWPPTKNDVMIALDWPRMVERRSGECETISDRQTFIYPSLERKLVTSNESAVQMACRIGYAVVPNFQVLLLSDALTQEHLIPPRYVATASLYGALYIVAALAIATLLFQRREVG